MAEEAAPEPTAAPAKQPAAKSTSNVFAKFNKTQMQEMKEASKKAKEDQPERAQRATSNVFAKFRKDQIQEFKEAFTMIDQDRDGVISVDDLREIYNSLGRVPSDSDLNEMIKEAPGPINFTMFLTLMGEKLHGMDPEDALRNAFAMFDKEGKGMIPEEYLKDLLENMGDNFGKDEVKQTWKEIPLEAGKVDYQRFVSLIKGKLGEEELMA